MNHDMMYNLVYCIKSPFILIVIPGLTEPAPYLIRGNPVFASWIPAGVYPDENRGWNDGSGINVKKRWTH
jgi:hypothetical protein